MKNLLRDAFPGNCILRAGTLRAASERSRLYVIFLTPRSGSSWLTELAMNTGVLGTPHEWFNDNWVYSDQTVLTCLPPRSRGIADINAYVDSIVDEGRGIAGLELSIFQALMLREMIAPSFDPRWLTASFYLRRHDIIAQAISLYRSVVSGVFHSFQSTLQDCKAFSTVEYNYDSLLQWLEFLIDNETRFEFLFRSCNVQPVELFYEDLQNDPLGSLQKIAWELGVPPPQSLPMVSLKVMRDQTSAAWRRRFTSELPETIINAIKRSRRRMSLNGYIPE